MDKRNDTDFIIVNHDPKCPMFRIGDRHKVEKKSLFKYECKYCSATEELTWSGFLKGIQYFGRTDKNETQT